MLVDGASGPLSGHDSTTSARGPAGAAADGRLDHPARTLVAVWFAAYVLLAGITIGAGLLVTRTAAAHGLRHWDVTVNRWFVHQRTATLSTLSDVGSHLAETPTVIGVGLVVVGLLWWRRRDLVAIGVLVFGLTLEVTVFVTTTALVDRSRPPVPRLDTAPPTSSFPSGHTAAAVVLTGSLIWIVLRVWSRRPWTAAVACVLALVPVAVALSRLYRGMHHPTDVIVGALLGAVCLAIAIVAVTRVATASRPRPHEEVEA